RLPPGPQTEVRRRRSPFHLERRHAVLGYCQRLPRPAVRLPKSQAIGSARAELEPAIEQHQVVAARRPGEWTIEADGVQVEQEEPRRTVRRKLAEQVARVRVGVSDAGVVEPGEKRSER